jgi:hypothetical protein
MAISKDTALLEAALLGYQGEAARITAAITDLQKRLGKKGEATLGAIRYSSKALHPLPARNTASQQRAGHALQRHRRRGGPLRGRRAS